MCVYLDVELWYECRTGEPCITKQWEYPTGTKFYNFLSELFGMLLGIYVFRTVGTLPVFSSAQYFDPVQYLVIVSQPPTFPMTSFAESWHASSERVPIT